MSLKQYSISLLLCTTLLQQAFAGDAHVAKVIMMRGSVKAKLKDGTLIDVKENTDLDEGAVLQTAEKSFAKLIFVDKSQMNLGPSSQMEITAFPKKEAGIITLVKGQIRSQVTKDYMEMDDKNKSKLFIKTNTAAMGIRGTDFQVNFNPENQNTALITFEGKVAMSNLGKLAKLDQAVLEKIVSSERAVFVTAGQISAVNMNISERAMLPTKLAPVQINALQENETGLKENNSNSSGSENKQFRNPIPPGAEGSVFSNTMPEVDKMAKEMAPQDSKSTEKAATKTEANGFFNNKTGEYKLPAGSIIDLKTVNLIPPPVNAVFDPNSKTYIVPTNYGQVDKATGEYKAPTGLKLNSDGKFQVVAPESTKSQSTEKQDAKQDTRNPASTGPAPVVNTPASIFEIRNDVQVFANNFAPVINNQTSTANATTLQNLASDKITTTEKVNQTNSNLGTSATSTKLKVIFNAQ